MRTTVYGPCEHIHDEVLSALRQWTSRQFTHDWHLYCLKYDADRLTVVGHLAYTLSVAEPRDGMGHKDQSAAED